MEVDAVLERDLLLAASANDLDAARALLARGVAVDCRDSRGLTPFATAVANRNWDVAQLLIENGADVDARNWRGWSPLINAVRTRKEDAVAWLIGVGARVNAPDGDDERESPLEHALRYWPDLQIVRSLVGAGADVNATIRGDYSPHLDVDSNDALITLAANLSDPRILECLLTAGASPNYVRESGESLLAYAARRGRLNIVKKLVERGAIVDATSNGSTTAIAVAAESNQWAVMLYLLEAGADVNTVMTSGGTLLAYAARNGKLESVQALVQGGANVNAVSRNGTTAVAAAAEVQAWEVVQYLVEFGADANTMWLSGDTLLAYAARRGRLNIVKKLVERGAIVNAVSRNGATAVGTAAESNQWEVMLYLLGAGADVNTVVINEDTLLAYAARHKQLESVQALVQGGAVVNAVSRNGTTAVVAAAEVQAWEVVQYLVEFGADVNAELENRNTLIVHAATSGESQAVRFLTTAGADPNTTMESGDSLLVDAATRGDLETVQALVEGGAHVNGALEDPKLPIVVAVKNGAGPVVRFLLQHGAGVGGVATAKRSEILAQAIRSGDLETVQALFQGSSLVNSASPDATAKVLETELESPAEVERAVVQFLVENGADVNADLEDGSTLLANVASRGKFETVRILVQGGAIVNKFSRDGTTALAMAAQLGRWSVAKFLLENGADVSTVLGSGDSLLAHVAKHGEFEMVQALITRGADVNTTSRDDTTAVMAAAMAGRGAIVRFLIDNGAHASTVLENGETLLAYVARRGGLGTVQMLIEHGADVNAASPGGITAVMVAAVEGEWAVVDLLLAHGAHMNTAFNGKSLFVHAVNSNSWSTAGLILKSGTAIDAAIDLFQKVLWHAATSGQSDVVRPCVQHGADPSAVMDNGDSLLLCAMMRDKWKTAKSLIDCGADVNAADAHGWTPLMHAAKRGMLEAVRTLVACKADANAVDRDGRTAFSIAGSAGYRAVQRLLMPYTRQSSGSISPEPDSKQQSWFVSPFEISLCAFVGVRSVGGEYLAKWLDADVVLKLFIPDGSGATFAKEVTVWHRLRHPNVIKLYGACDLGHYFFVCELASNGSLIEYLSSSASTNAPRTPWKYLYEASLGLAYLHERGIVHGNLRGSNILIGSDGMAKLSEFGLSGSAKVQRGSSSTWGLARWHSPESLRGKPASFAADIYSLGLCILETLTSKEPWAGLQDREIKHAKEYWTPESSSSYLANDLAPVVLTDELRQLSIQMCAWNPQKRLSISFVVQILEGFAQQEARDLEERQPDPEPLMDVEGFEQGSIQKLWVKIHATTKGNDLQQFAGQQLAEIHDHLCGSSWTFQTLFQYRVLLEDFIAAMVPDSYQNRILQLSSTRATTCSFHVVQRRIDAMWTMLGGTSETLQVRRRLWEEQRSKQLELFVSEVSETLVSLDKIDGEEDRCALLTLLESEINALESTYTPEQRAVLENAYEQLKKDALASVVTKVQPWFLPWYELVVDTSMCLGVGGFGCVYRARWLDSEVVVKEVKRLGTKDEFKWSKVASSSQQSISRTTTRGAVVGKEQRVKMRHMFEREVTVWFGLSHPHVVRLFGACHVGIPFFACEFASNGSLDKYLRAHPTELWGKLYETALGVQYLQSRKIIHCDLKCTNAVVGSDGKAKVTDFGLSSEIEQAGGELTGAWQWVAPECFEGGPSMRSFASDVYALGMCVVEALRVVLAGTLRKNDPGFYPYPWGNLENSVVKYRVLRRELPQRPEECPEAAWALVERMCAYDPKDRIKISTVVDELAKLAGIDTRENFKETAAETISNVITSAKRAFSPTTDTVQRIYALFWDRLEHLSTLIVSIKGDLELLRPLIDRACECMRRCDDTPLLETQEIEDAFKGYDLHRRLDKLIDANFWPIGGEGDEVHKWEAACTSFLSVRK